MDLEAFRAQAHKLVDWMADYLEKVEEYPVKSQVQPKEIYRQIPAQAPELGEPMEAIWEDFQKVILKGITHWQSPNFYAYFPANNSYPSILAEMLMATVGAQCMVWETSPAATELEERMMEWLITALGLPQGWQGVIQDTASTATLCALLSARERCTDYLTNEQGVQQAPTLRVYASSQTHSSIEKAVKIAGLGKQNLVYVAVDEQFILQPAALQEAIEADLAAGYQPMCVIATIGTTSTTAVDPLPAMAFICEQYDLWLHVDAAYAGVATILPAYRWMIEGLEKADSYVFNPHKWMFVNFDCTAYFVKDAEKLVRTFEILPEYLKTAADEQVNNYRDWGIPLGRRFRALKLWFVLRSFGIEGIQEKVSKHIALAQWLGEQVVQHPQFELLAPVQLGLVCFRYKPKNLSATQINQLNE
ncbi:MAG: pyridoxal-dependent decarboxylase [Bacteroidota bacterium]